MSPDFSSLVHWILFLPLGAALFIALFLRRAGAVAAWLSTGVAFAIAALALRLLTAAPGDEAAGLWRGPYLRRAVPLDPWGKPYLYRYPGDTNPNGFDLLSYGADGQAGGDGENADILGWQ